MHEPGCVRLLLPDCTNGVLGCEPSSSRPPLLSLAKRQHSLCHVPHGPICRLSFSERVMKCKQELTVVGGLLLMLG